MLKKAKRPVTTNSPKNTITLGSPPFMKENTSPWPAAVLKQNPSSHQAWSEKCPDATGHSRFTRINDSFPTAIWQATVRWRQASGNTSRIRDQQWTIWAALPLHQHHNVWRHGGQNLSRPASSQLVALLCSRPEVAIRAQPASAAPSSHGRWATRLHRAYEVIPSARVQMDVL